MLCCEGRRHHRGQTMYRLTYWLSHADILFSITESLTNLICRVIENCTLYLLSWSVSSRICKIDCSLRSSQQFGATLIQSMPWHPKSLNLFLFVRFPEQNCVYISYFVHAYHVLSISCPLSLWVTNIKCRVQVIANIPSPPNSSPLLDPCILLSILFVKTLNVWCSRRMRDKVSHSVKKGRSFFET